MGKAKKDKDKEEKRKREREEHQKKVWATAWDRADQAKKDRMANKGKKLNLWDPVKMRAALKYYDDQLKPGFDEPVLSIRKLGEKFIIPYNTLR